MTVDRGRTEQEPSSPPPPPAGAPEFDPASLGKRLSLESSAPEPQSETETETNDSAAAAAPPSSAPPPDAAEVARVAGYGEPPSSVFGAIAYAVRVWRRRAALRSQLEDAQALVELGRRDVDAALARFGEALRPHADALRPLKAAFGEVEAQESESLKHIARREAVESQAQEALSALDKRLRDARDEARPIREREARLVARENDARQALRQARVERPPAELGEHLRASARITDRESELAALQTELGLTRDELAVAMDAVADLEEELRLLGRAGQRLGQRDRAFRTEAGSALEAALRNLGEEALGRGLGADVAPSELHRAQAAMTTGRARDADVVLYRRALDGYDRRAYRAGTLVLSAIVGALLLAAAVVVLR